MINTDSEKKKLLIRTTYRLIAEKGFANLKLQDVADGAGVSKGIILYHFESKEKLFIAVLEWLVRRIERHIRNEVEKARTPGEKMAAYVSSMFVGIQENRQYYRVYLDFLSQSIHNASMQNFNNGFYAQCRQLHDEILGEGIVQGVFRPIPFEESARVIRSLVDGLGVRWLFDEPLTFESYRSAALNAVRSYLGS